MIEPQYSTGKTSFIKYLLGRDFPGLRVGPSRELTDRFVAVIYGEEDRVIPGNALVVSPEVPYRGLDKFGTRFLNKFEGSQCKSRVLQNITIVDTPGVLSGEKQRMNRGYDFGEVAEWFAARSDLILLLFDAHKLDISDEFRAVIERMKGHDDKARAASGERALAAEGRWPSRLAHLRPLPRPLPSLSPSLPFPAVLARARRAARGCGACSTADAIDRQKLMRVYGALMWSIGKALRTPEVLRAPSARPGSSRSCTTSSRACSTSRPT